MKTVLFKFVTVVTQVYQPEIMTEYVIRGNSAILKCSIPSYIAEFVTVDAWIRDDGETYVQHLTTFNQGICLKCAVYFV